MTEFSQMLTKITVEAALNAELDQYLGYGRHQSSGNANSRKNYLFLGSDAGAERAATLYSLQGTAKLNGINPEKPACVMCCR